MGSRHVSSIVRKRRREILLEQFGRTCWLCHGVIPTHVEPTLDHIVPRSKGGPNAVSNLRLAHAGCNQKRGDGPPPVLLLTERMMLVEEAA
jgi:5-methylcytosine-specific restriction endonuclease McrA